MWQFLTRRLHFRNEEELVEKDKGSRSYYTLLAVSAFIATLGVLVDNSTVIIGAMLIAPLMVPIMALSVAIAKGESEKMIRSLGNISMSVLVVVFIAYITANLVPVVDIPEQALLRAQPNIVDLLIAIASGMIGMYAYLHKDIPESLVGVAIAVSLVPPLTVIGIGFTLGVYLLSLGATVLFFTNVVAIIGAAVVVLFWHGRFAGVTGTEQERDVALASSGITIVIAVLLAVLLSGAFLQVYKEEQRKELISETLTPLIEAVGGKITELEVTHGKGQTRVDVIARVPEEVERLDIKRMNNALVYALEDSVELQVSLIRIQQATRDLEDSDQQKIKELKGKTKSGSFEELEVRGGGEGELIQILEASNSATEATVSADPASEVTTSPVSQ